MKHLYIFSALLTISCSLWAQQTKTIEIPIYQKDTSLWYKETVKLIPQLQLKDLQTDTTGFYFRLWTSNLVIGIYTSDRQAIYATITSFAQRYSKAQLIKGKYEIDKVFFKTKKLDADVVKNIYQSIISQQIENIPSDDKIKGWQSGFDGTEYLIEVSGKNSYAFRTYWTPRIFADSLPEAKRIQTLIDYLYNSLEIGKYYLNLKLPPGSYKTEGIPGVQISTQTTQGAKTIYDLL